ncbi:hypothetical protein [Streptomyces sp. NPDC002676]
MTGMTGYFPDVGRALFSKLETAQDWCERRAAEKYPGDIVEWADREEPEQVGTFTGQIGQTWHRQVPKAGHNIPRISLGSVVSIPLEAET